MGRLIATLAVLNGLLLGGVLHAADPAVCLDDRVGLSAPAKASFYREFSRLVGPQGVEISFAEACDPGAIRLALTHSRPNFDRDILGAVRILRGSVLPEMEIYLDPVMELLASAPCWSVIGRALARVAAHEVAHFLDQAEQHRAVGVLQQNFDAQQLASEDSYPFRWIRASR